MRKFNLFKNNRFSILAVLFGYTLSIAAALFVPAVEASAASVIYDPNFKVRSSTLATPNQMGKPLTINHSITPTAQRFGTSFMSFLVCKDPVTNATKELSAPSVKGLNFTKADGTTASIRNVQTTFNVPVYDSPSALCKVKVGFSTMVQQPNGTFIDHQQWIDPVGRFVITKDPTVPTVTQKSATVQSYNIGNSAVGSWQSDASIYNYTGTTSSDPSNTTPDTSQVVNPAPADVYKTLRWGDMRYSLPNLIQGKRYLVRLHFYEYNSTSAGQRLFDVSANGQPLLTNFDIFAEAGGRYKAITKDFYVDIPHTDTGTDPSIGGLAGKMDISLKSIAGKGSATISGIEVIDPIANNTKETPAVSYAKRIKGINSGSANGSSAWVADADYTNGVMSYGTSAAPSLQNVVDPAPVGVYQKSRYSNCVNGSCGFSYKFQHLVPNKAYKIRLHLNESKFTAQDQRVFNVKVNGQPGLTNFDLFKEAGGKDKALVKELFAPANAEGKIVVDFVNIPGKDNATINGIEIFESQNANFYTEGTKIYTPSGQEFIAVGANIGLDFKSELGPAEGHATDAKTWGWNMIRLQVQHADNFFNGAPPAIIKNRQALYDRLDNVINEYTSKGIVMLIDPHSIYTANTQYFLDETEKFVTDMAAKYKDNPYVWFGTVNEPREFNMPWTATQDRLVNAIRSQGAQNVIVIDPPTWGQDIGPSASWAFPNARFSYEAPFTPYLINKYGNIVLGHHNYGALYDDTSDGTNGTQDRRYSSYISKVHAAGIPLITTEFGFTYNKSSTTGSNAYVVNRRAALAVFTTNPQKGVGVLAWNGLHADNYNFKKKTITNSDGTTKTTSTSFYDPDGELTELGQRLWNLGRPDAPVAVVPQGY